MASSFVKRFKFEPFTICNIEASVEKEKQGYYNVVEH